MMQFLTLDAITNMTNPIEHLSNADTLIRSIEPTWTEADYGVLCDALQDEDRHKEVEALQWMLEEGCRPVEIDAKWYWGHTWSAPRNVRLGFAIQWDIFEEISKWSTSIKRAPYLPSVSLSIPQDHFWQQIQAILEAYKKVRCPEDEVE